MGSRKHNKAEQTKEAKKQVSFAKLNNCPTSPRKMRLMADMIRGMNVEQALHVLKHSPQEASGRLHKLLLSALANWQAKNEGTRMEDTSLFVKEIGVDGARSLKRIRTAPQGRAHRIKKRSNHVTLVIDNRGAVSTEKETANQVIKTK
ncbi:MAG: 50S ribosomal protein L22 [Bacteroidetes bacterium HGW-Bacteroidetes-9]|jgi:large subunit ribosomal protein L22|nr:MAG: 50S ribosomal protein L22 [Bacteroidetes bacterium HGW-Bacteroidetes-9]